jgi:hypothetical protein
MNDRIRSLRAIAVNAITWGVAWGVVGAAIFAVINLFNPDPGIDSLVERIGLAAFAAVAWGVRFALAGAVIGTAFATMLRFGFRGKRLAELSPIRFALLGALVGGVGVPLYLQLMNVLSGDGPIAWGLVLDDGPWAAVFGAIAGGGTILLARRGAALAPPTPMAEIEASGDQPAEELFSSSETAASRARHSAGSPSGRKASDNAR